MDENGFSLEALGGRSCLSCEKPVRAVLLLTRSGFYPGHPKHEIGYNHIVLLRCDVCGGGQIERLDHDCFDFEDVWDQSEWYVLSPEDMKQLEPLLSSCPQPLDEGCQCALHTSLRTSRFPSISWEWALEAPAHVHRARLRVKGSTAVVQVEGA